MKSSSLPLITAAFRQPTEQLLSFVIHARFRIACSYWLGYFLSVCWTQYLFIYLECKSSTRAYTEHTHRKNITKSSKKVKISENYFLCVFVRKMVSVQSLFFNFVHWTLVVLVIFSDYYYYQLTEIVLCHSSVG